MPVYFCWYLGQSELMCSQKRAEDEPWTNEHLKQEDLEIPCYQPRIFPERKYKLYQELLRDWRNKMRALDLPMRKPSVILGVVGAESIQEWIEKVVGGKYTCHLKNKRYNCLVSYFNYQGLATESLDF